MGMAVARARAHSLAGGREREVRAPARDVTCAPRLSIAPDAATIGTLLRSADGGTRERLVGTLQRLHGNGAVGRLLDPAGGLPLQRWRVGLPPRTTDCDRIVDYVSTHSPYAATSGAAFTRASFTWTGNPAYAGEDGGLVVSVADPAVASTVTVDMPHWAPTDPSIRAAWTAAMADLRAHERVHEGIAARWETTLQGRLAALRTSVADRRIATFRAAVAAEWRGWIAEHAAEQAGIDPYWATFQCPPTEAPTSEAAGAE